MKREIKVSPGVAIVGLIFIATAILGWGMNFVKLILMMGDVSASPMMIGRAVGVFFAPLGAVLGFF